MLLLATFLLGSLLQSPTRAWAQSNDRPAPSATDASNAQKEKAIKELTRTGVAAYRKNNLEAAQKAFEEAWRLQPHSEIAALLADVEMKLGHYRRAQGLWEYYIKELPPDKAEAEAQLAECRRRLGSFRVYVDSPGAVVYLDGTEVGQAPIDADVWVDPGDHKLYAKLSDRASPEKMITVAAGETHTVTLTLARPPDPMAVASGLPAASPPPREQVKRDESGVQPRTIVLIAGSVLTAAAVGVGVVYTMKANAAWDDSEALRISASKNAEPTRVANDSYCTPPDRAAACDELATKVNEWNTARNIATGSFIAAGALGLGTAASYFLWPNKSPSADRRARIRVAPVIGSSHRGLSAELSF
jgi:tetratricopeptide (TPR) repeat protein